VLIFTPKLHYVTLHYKCASINAALAVSPGEHERTRALLICYQHCLDILTVCRMHVTIAAPPVLGEVSPTFLIQKEGDTVDLFCEASATPFPTLSWRKDGQQLVPSDRVRLSGSRVQLRRLERSDGGAYACTFTNPVGQVSHVIRLVVEGTQHTQREHYTLKISSRISINLAQCCKNLNKTVSSAQSHFSVSEMLASTASRQHHLQTSGFRIVCAKPYACIA